jgi:hypothetical protein
MEFNPDRTLAIIYALRFKIKYLDSVIANSTGDGDDRLDAQEDRAYLELIADSMEQDYRQNLGLKPSDPV